MPAIDTVTGGGRKPPKARAVRPQPAVKAKPAPRYTVTVPDQHEASRTTRLHPVTPDQADRQRPVAQRAHDRQVTARVVRQQRETAVAKAGRGSGTRAVKAWVRSNVHDEIAAKKTDLGGHTGHGAGHTFAAITANLPIAGIAGRTFVNAAKDAAELAVTTPSSVAKLASDAVHHPGKVPGELAAPYIQLAKHPAKFSNEHPVSTALMVQPAARMPGRVLGKAARVTGHQTLERPAATLAGTAIKEAKTGSRDFFVRRAQAKKDAANPTPTVTAKDVQRRVDEHFDQSKHEARRIESAAVRATRKATKGQPKDVRREAEAQAREHAHEEAQRVAEERFAREFGANVRLSHGVAVREALHGARRQAVQRLDAAKTTAAQANTAHDAALADARAAVAKARTSPKLASLETMRSGALRTLATAQRAHATARAAHGVAKGRAEVLSRNVGGGGKAGGYGVEIGQRGVDTAATAVKAARQRVKELDQQIGVERQRIKGVPPAQHAALTNAIHARGQARVVLAQARAEAHAAAHAHIAAKQAMTNATLVRPTAEGRLFAHKADAATVVKKLNQQATPIARGKGYRFTVHSDNPEHPVTFERQTAATAEPLTFVVRKVGEDRWAAVPKVASQQLMHHHAVGTSPAVMAKLMRRSRGAFTSAVLPLSAKWLAGQGVEAGIRSAVAGAGPMDLMRFHKVVKRLNAHTAGAGDVLRDRVTGGHFDLTGPARDFANGKSLAAEFEHTSIEQPMAAVTRAAHAAPAKAVRQGWGHYTHVVLGAVNGAIEQTARKAMAGQAIKNSPLMERHIVGLSDKALEDAAKGLRGTHNQVELGRAVDRMYGQYQKFSPDKRSLLLHWTPFLPWYLNVATFLGKVLPVDHPVQAALLANISSAEEEWRKSHDLSLLQANHVPDFLLGSAPNGKGGFQRIAHYTPFGVGSDLAGSVSDLMLPQFVGPLKNMGGVDWKWQPLTHGGKHGKPFNQGERTVRALVTAAEEQIPGVSQAGKISGVTPRLVDKNNPATIKSPGEVLKGYLPTTATSNGQPPAATSGGSSGRVKVPGVTGGRVKIPGATGGRVKIP